MSQIENMVMQKTDYSIPDSMGILMTFKYDNVNLMDFQRIDELHDIGYNRTISTDGFYQKPYPSACESGQ